MTICEHERRNSVVPPSYVPVCMKNNNSHPGPDMFTKEDMPVEMLDALGLVAQVTQVVKDYFFQIQNEHDVNHLVDLVFHEIGMHLTKLEHRFECHGFWHAIQNHIFKQTCLNKQLC